MKKSLLGTMLLSVFSLQAQAQRYYTLDELKDFCRTAETNNQILPFTSDYSCSERRTFWVSEGIQEIPLPTESEVMMKALIKDGAHQSDWLYLPGHSEQQWGTCVALEKIEARASFAVTLTSCADLERITTEDEYCSLNLAPVWDECVREQIDAMATGRFVIPVGGHCSYRRLNVERKCSDADIVQPKQSQQQQSNRQQQQLPPPPCQNPDQCQSPSQQGPSQQGPSQQGPSQQGPYQQSQGYSQQCIVGENCDAYDLGADVRKVVVDKSFAHGKHRAVEISSNPKEGGMIAALRLKRGAVVSSINRIRTRNVAEFKQALTTAKAEGHARIEYCKSNCEKGGAWLSETVTPF